MQCETLTHPDVNMGSLRLVCPCVSAALATEDPSPDLLLETPHGRTEPLINGAMWTHIMVQGIYQVPIP